MSLILVDKGNRQFVLGGKTKKQLLYCILLSEVSLAVCFFMGLINKIDMVCLSAKHHIPQATNIPYQPF